MRHPALVTSLLAPLALSACFAPEPAGEPNPAAADPNATMVLSAQGRPAIQETARTSLLEDNEHLRDLLSKALAEKRTLEARLQESELARTRLEAQLRDQSGSIQTLSEQVAGYVEQLAAIEGIRDRLEKERRALAEMYAVEKRQRLAFEKELLEQEIASRTHAKGDG